MGKTGTKSRVARAGVKGSAGALPRKPRPRGVEASIRELQAENRRLARNAQTFRRLFEANPNPMWVYDLETLRFLEVNDAAVASYGYRRDEFLAMTIADIRPGDDVPRLLENVSRVREDALDYAGLWRHRRKDGSLIDVEITSHELEFEGRRAEVVMAQDVTERRRVEAQGHLQAKQLEKAFLCTIEVVMNLSEMRDPYTVGHERRVAEIAVAIGAGLGLDARGREGLRVAGCLHDVGKIAVPSEILAKPSRLTPLEYELIKAHPIVGHDILKGIDSPWPVAQVALQHHERLDGSGYPNGLAGAQIIPEARIMAVADVVEAMAAHRPYRPGLGIEVALSEIERGSGTLYDPDVAGECLSLFRTKGFVVSS